MKYYEKLLTVTEPCTTQVTLQVRCKWLKDAQDKATSLDMTLERYIIRVTAADLYPEPVDDRPKRGVDILAEM